MSYETQSEREWERDCAANKCGGYEEEPEEQEELDLSDTYDHCGSCGQLNLMTDRHCRKCGAVLGQD